MVGNAIRERVDFENARVAIQTVSGSRLIVSGTTPNPMDVRLEPVPQIPETEWWGIEVVGYHDGTGEDVMTPYEVSLEFESLPSGAKGIEVIGATKTERV